MKKMNELKIKLFLDGANLADLKTLADVAHIQGFTTNPSLMKKAGITDYEAFVKAALPLIKNKPISFEVFADDFSEMKRQALKLKNYGPNVYVKIPITNTKQESALPLIKELVNEGVKLNITAILILEQVKNLAAVLKNGVPSIISVFAGRIADTGVDPSPMMRESRKLLKNIAGAELLWASTREVLNIIQAEEAGCDIITVPVDILKKISFIGCDLRQFSLETVQQFYEDARSSGFKL